MKYTIEIDTEKPTIVANEVLVFSKEKIIELLNYITCATSKIINEQKQENEQLKQQNEKLKQQNEKMRNCVNCKNMIKGTRDVCNDCFKSKDFSHWELAE